jgi:hypothetical protein
MFRREAQGPQGSPLAAASGRAFELLTAAVEACQREGKAPEGDPLPLILLAWSAVHGLASLCVDGALSKMTLSPEQAGPMVAKLTADMFAALVPAPAPPTALP